jgi:hypothetical protein
VIPLWYANKAADLSNPIASASNNRNSRGYSFELSDAQRRTGNGAYVSEERRRGHTATAVMGTTTGALGKNI